MSTKKNKIESGCFYCGRSPKKIPYGAKRTLMWCGNCDCDLVSPINKKKARADGKKEIKKQLEEE